MCQKNLILLLFLFFVCDFGLCQRRLDTVGAGYNIYEGNPLFSDKGDEGIKSSGNVFNLSFSENKSTQDGNYRIPNEVDSGYLKLCTEDSEQYSFTGMQGYLEISKKQFSNGIIIPFSSFSMSKEYEETDFELQKERQVQFTSKVVCQVYQLSLKSPFSTPLSSDFILAVKKSFESGNWTLFIRKYGTHYIDSCIQGGRISSKQLMTYESYAVLSDSKQDVKRMAGLNFKLSIGSSRLSEQEKEEAQRTASFFSSQKILAIPFPIKESFSEWQKAVEQDVQPISYTVNSLDFLITQENFPSLNVTAIKLSMKQGFENYCKENPSCKNPSGDPSWPQGAYSNVTLKGAIGISNMGALYDGRPDESTLPQTPFISLGVDKILPDQQISKIKVYCHINQNNNFLVGIKYEICNFNNICQGEQTLGYTDPKVAFMRQNWTQNNFGTPVTGISYSAGGPYPYITNLQFYTKLGPIFNENACIGNKEDFKVISGKYLFGQPIVGFKAFFDSLGDNKNGENSVRYLQFFVNFIQFKQTPELAQKQNLKFHTFEKYQQQENDQENKQQINIISQNFLQQKINNIINSNNHGSYLFLYNYFCKQSTSKVLSYKGAKLFSTPSEVQANQKQNNFVYDTAATNLRLGFYYKDQKDFLEFEVFLEDPHGGENLMKIQGANLLCYGLYQDQYVRGLYYKGYHPFINACYLICSEEQ